MKKLSAVIALVIFAIGCGSSTEIKKEMTENPTVELKDSNFYPITVIKSPQKSELFGAFINIPDGFTLDKERYEQSGEFVFKHKDGISTFTIFCKANPGLNNAITYMDMEIVKPNEKIFSFGDRKDIENWSTPMPMFEDTLSAEASFSTISYDRKIEQVELTGTYFVWWFNHKDEKEPKANSSFAIIMSQECKKTDWETMSPKFDLMRKTFFRLPSRPEAFVNRSESEINASEEAVALRMTQDRLFKLENGEPMAPGWETLVGKYRFAIDTDRNQVYLVPNEKTASGLLPHPTISGWTVDPMLGKSIFDYIPLPSQPTLSPIIPKKQP